MFLKTIMGKAETASREKKKLTLPVCGVSGAANSVESRGGGTRAVSFWFAPFRGVTAVLLGFFALAAGAQITIEYGNPYLKHHYRLHTGTTVLLNSPELTPGAVRTISKKEVCEGGSTKQFRHTTEAMKKHVYALYGVDKTQTLASEDALGPKAQPPLYEIDHLISLELGGEDDEKNLWPQPYYMHPGAHEKDAVENYLHREVCGGKMELQEAQREIATDWYQVYLDAHLSGAPKGTSGAN